MKRLKKSIIAGIMSVMLIFPQPSRADFWGADIPILLQILANAVSQLIQLKQILGTGTDTLSLLRDVNRGIRDGLAVIQMMNPRFNPGLYGDIETADRVLSV